MLRVILAAALAAPPASAVTPERAEERQERREARREAAGGPSGAAEKAIKAWPETARAAARDMMAKYGDPAEVGPDALAWYGNGPWKKTIVHRRAWPHYAGMQDKDYLENVIGYGVPDDRVEDLGRFDKRLDVDPATAELSSRSESEAMNFLALNLADEIVSGRRSVGEAREFQRKTARLAAAGKSSPYLGGLLFDARNGATPNPWSRR